MWCWDWLNQRCPSTNATNPLDIIYWIARSLTRRSNADSESVQVKVNSNKDSRELMRKTLAFAANVEGGHLPPVKDMVLEK